MRSGRPHGVTTWWPPVPNATNIGMDPTWHIDPPDLPAMASCEHGRPHHPPHEPTAVAPPAAHIHRLCDTQHGDISMGTAPSPTNTPLSVPSPTVAQQDGETHSPQHGYRLLNVAEPKSLAVLYVGCATSCPWARGLPLGDRWPNPTAWCPPCAVSYQSSTAHLGTDTLVPCTTPQMWP